MSALKLDIEIKQGATFQREFTALKTVDGSPFDFTGYTLRGKLRNNFGKELTTFDLLADVNKIIAELTKAKTTLLPISITFNGNYDIEAESPAGVVYPVAYGRARISENQNIQ